MKIVRYWYKTSYVQHGQKQLNGQERNPTKNPILTWNPG